MIEPFLIEEIYFFSTEFPYYFVTTKGERVK